MTNPLILCWRLDLEEDISRSCCCCLIRNAQSKADVVLACRADSKACGNFGMVIRTVSQCWRCDLLIARVAQIDHHVGSFILVFWMFQYRKATDCRVRAVTESVKSGASVELKTNTVGGILRLRDLRCREVVRRLN